MNSIEKRKYKAALDEWILKCVGMRRCAAVTLTFDPDLVSALNKKFVERSVQYFFKRVNRDLYGLAGREGHLGLNFLSVIEGGEAAYAKSLHLHAIVVLPPNCDPNLFVRCLDWNWRKVKGHGLYGKIEVCWDITGWVPYLTKLSSKTKYADDILFEHMAIAKDDSLPSARVARLARKYPEPIAGTQIPVNSAAIVGASNFGSLLA